MNVIGWGGMLPLGVLVCIVAPLVFPPIVWWIVRRLTWPVRMLVAWVSGSAPPTWFGLQIYLYQGGDGFAFFVIAALLGGCVSAAVTAFLVNKF